MEADSQVNQELFHMHNSDKYARSISDEAAAADESLLDKPEAFSADGFQQ